MNIPKKSTLFLFLAAVFFLCSTIMEIIPYFLNFHISYGFEIILFVIQKTALPISIICVCIAILFLFKENFKQKTNEENEDISELRKRLIEDKAVNDKDILELMLKNMSEINQYYKMSKSHARLSFALAVVFCIFGLLLLAYTVTLDKQNLQPIIIGMISGTICELFAGTALLVHKSSLSQLNHYYKSLHENERFLSTVNLVGKLSHNLQDEAFCKIIDSSLDDISILVQNNDMK